MSPTAANFVFGVLTVLIGGGFLFTKPLISRVFGAVIFGIGAFALALGFGASVPIAMIVFVIGSLAVAFGRSGFKGTWITALAILILVVLSLIVEAAPFLSQVGVYFTWLCNNFDTIASYLIGLV